MFNSLAMQDSLLAPSLWSVTLACPLPLGGMLFPFQAAHSVLKWLMKLKSVSLKFPVLLWIPLGGHPACLLSQPLGDSTREKTCLSLLCCRPASLIPSNHSYGMWFSLEFWEQGRWIFALNLLHLTKGKDSILHCCRGQG